MTDREKIIEHIDKIDQFSRQPGNGWLLDELRKRFGGNPSKNAAVKSVADDVSFIRSALNIRANNSISYDFIDNQRLRDQLIIDNLRMENAAFDLREKEIDRFYSFCVNAFYQVENIVNYYFFIRYPQIEDLLKVISEYTEKDGEDGKFQFHRSQNNSEVNVGDIPVFFKINAICNILFPGDKNVKITLNNLRRVRNEGEHRCQIIYNQKDENNKLYRFLETTTFNSIRIILIKLVSSVKSQIQDSPHDEKVAALIVSKLPGACFVSFGSENQQVPVKLLNKTSHMKEGDSVIIIKRNGNIIDIYLKRD